MFIRRPGIVRSKLDCIGFALALIIIGALLIALSRFFKLLEGF